MNDNKDTVAAKTTVAVSIPPGCASDSIGRRKSAELQLRNW